MFISKVQINNFKGFYGLHTFQLSKGLNVILGPGGGGKTNLCQAIEFGLFGGIWGPPGHSYYSGTHLNNLVNIERREECLKEDYFYYDTSVRLEIVKGDEKYKIDRELSFDGEGEARGRLNYSTDIKLGLSRDVFHDLIYNDERMPEDHRLESDISLSAGERISKYLVNQAERNIEKDIRMIILDSSLGRLAREKKSDVMKNIVGQGLDQIILLENPSAYHNGMRVVESKKYLLGATLEKINVSVEGFPFQPSVLGNELRLNLDGSYMVEGDVYEKQMYDEQYCVVFSELCPSGGRFSDSETQISFRSNM